MRLVEMKIYTTPTETTRFPVTAGLLIRGPFRRALQRAGIRFIEDKGILNSQFVIIEPTDNQLVGILNYIERVNDN
jgi:hypothetical protein